MSDIDKIKAQIERLRKENGKDGRPSHVTEVICTHLLSFIDSLPEEPLIPSNSVGLEEEIKNYFEGLWPGTETAEQCNTDLHFTPLAIMRLASHFAEWGAKH